MSQSLTTRSRVLYSALSIAACIFAAACASRSNALPEGIDDPSADDMLLRASAVCLVEITNLEEFDERPADGDNWVKASFDVIESSGDIPEFLYLVKNSGGLRPPPPPDAPPPKPPRLTHDTLNVGEKHWFVFGTEGDGSDLPYGMTGWWTADADDIPKSVIDSVEQDRFQWHPVFDTTCRLIHEWHADNSVGTVTVRVRDDSQQLWSRQFEANVDPNHETTYVWNHGVAMDMEWPEGEPFLGLQVKLIKSLPADSWFNVPAGTYRVDHVLDMKTGKTLATWIATHQTAWFVHAFQQYDAQTGRLVISAEMKSLESGGIDVGGDREAWFRKIEKRFDADSGELLSTKTFRHGNVQPPGADYTQSGWILVSTVQPDE